MLVFLAILLLAVSSSGAVDLRIALGQTTTIQKYPYQVSVRYLWNHLCGGAIISSKYVITAAHCTDGSWTWTFSVRVGSSFTDKGGTTIGLSSYYQHPYFKKAALDYDISILKLSKNVQFGLDAYPVRLPPTSYWIREYTNCTVTGWGRLANNKNPTQLQVTTVPLLSNRTCREYYHINISNRMLCAGGWYTGVCPGDSGSPLVANGFLVGIVSGGFECLGYQPDVYASVLALRSFITSVTGL